MISISRQTPQPLLPRQRRQLILLTLLLACALLGLLRVAVSATSGGQGLPNLETLLAGNLDSQATRTPVPTAPRIIQWQWALGTATLAEDPGPAAPEEYVVYLPGVFRSDPVTWGQIEVEPEPPPASPTPNWPNGLDRLTNSKLGLHIVVNNDPFIMEFIRRARPRVVKAVDDLGWLADVKQVSPNTITLGRIQGQNEDLVLVKDPVAAADEYIASQLEKYRLNPGVDFWEGWNEFVPVNHERLAWYAKFEARRACAMQSLGYRAGVGGFSVGVPEFADMAVFMPALEAAYRCGAIFTLHEYNSPTMACGVGVGGQSLIPGAAPLGVPAGYHTLRYRYWYESYLKPLGMGDLPLVISEAGVEGRPTPGGPCNDPGGRAWKAYGDWWVAQGYGPTPAEAYVNVLSWYDEQLRQDPYVLGATLFTAGAIHGDATWFPFDLHDALVPLAHYAVGLP
ncbi:MAG: hypothetical protein IT318_03065 [Anaerolineales bacterium]|nr:hypothetical protein [Anaerolineales bacterium]